MEKKAIYKKWWFWVIVVVLVALIYSIGATPNTPNTISNNINEDNLLPTLNANDYIGKESLLVYHELKDKGYTVKANYTTELGEKLAVANQKIIDTFEILNPNNEENRLSVDAYAVTEIIQNGNNIELIIK